MLTRFRVAAQPLRYLDYLIEKYERGAVIDGGSVLVNVPSPARYAFHKLISTQERAAAMHTKVKKDFHQAAQLFLVLADMRPGDLEIAWEDLHQRRDGSVTKVKKAMRILKRQYPDAYEAIQFLARS